MVKFNISTVATHIAILLNGFLIWLIWKKSGKSLESYRKILYLGAIFDFIFVIIGVMTKGAVAYSKDFVHDFLVINGWSAFFGSPFDYIIACLSVYVSYSSMTIASVQFVYRFFLICFNYTLGIAEFCGLVILALFFPLYFLIAYLIYYSPKPNQQEIYGPILSKILNSNETNSFIVTSTTNTYGSTDTIMTAAISIVSFGIIIFCSSAVVYKLWKHSKNFSTADRKVQNQVSIVLFCEAMVPFITMIIPFNFLSALAQAFPWFPSIFTQISGFCPVLNPIVKIIVIPPFRRTIIGKFFGTDNSSVVVTISSVSTTHTGPSRRMQPVAVRYGVRESR